MKFRFTILIILISVLTVFSFWPSFLEAHYDGLVSCPIVMGDMSGCQNMTAHVNNILAHIASFSNMLAFILVVGILGGTILFVLSIFDAVNLIDDSSLYGKSSKHFLELSFFAYLVIRFKNNVFYGLRTGILNTKVF